MAWKESVRTLLFQTIKIHVSHRILVYTELYHKGNIRTSTQLFQRYYAYLTHYKGVICTHIGQEFHFRKFRSVYMERNL